jgi:hypothetical protein
MLVLDTEKELEEAVERVISWAKKELLYVGVGRTRIVFLTPSQKSVIKIPLSWDGMADNDWEYRTFTKNRKSGECVYAPCRPSSLLGFPVLLMRKLDLDIPPVDQLPDWAGCIDCFQVGLDKEGRLLAYDYGWN